MIVEVTRTGLLTMIERETLGARLVLCMVKRGLTIKQFAEISGVGASTVRRYVDATSQPGWDLVAKLADAAGCRREWLALGQGEPDWADPWKPPRRRATKGL